MNININMFIVHIAIALEPIQRHNYSYILRLVVTDGNVT